MINKFTRLTSSVRAVWTRRWQAAQVPEHHHPAQIKRVDVAVNNRDCSASGDRFSARLSVESVRQ